MRFLNEWDIHNACDKYGRHPVLGPASRFLRDFMIEVNHNSDGWAYWRQPLRSAQTLIELIEKPDTATHQAFAKALRPIRAFYSRHGFSAGMTFPALDPTSTSERNDHTTSQMPLF